MMAARRRTRTAAERERDEQQIAALRAALHDGWVVEQPIIARPAFSNHPDAPAVLHCIMLQAQRRRLLVLSDTPAARRLLAEYDLGKEL
jgi:hypothetical protein